MYEGESSAKGMQKLHNEQIRSLFSAVNIISIIKLRTVRLARNMGHVGEKRPKHFSVKILHYLVRAQT